LVLWINALQGTVGSGDAKHAVFMRKLVDYFVYCSITGDEIPLSELKYWNVDRQETFKNAGVGLARYTETLSET